MVTMGVANLCSNTMGPTRLPNQPGTLIHRQVAKSGPNPEGGFLVEVIRVQGKDRSAAFGAQPSAMGDQLRMA